MLNGPSVYGSLLCSTLDICRMSLCPHPLVPPASPIFSEVPSTPRSHPGTSCLSSRTVSLPLPLLSSSLCPGERPTRIPSPPWDGGVEWGGDEFRDLGPRFYPFSLVCRDAPPRRKRVSHNSFGYTTLRRFP